jgi:acyl-coenzyme A thioesterase PaaI-like protein
MSTQEERRESASPYGEWADSDLMSYRYLASAPRALDRDHSENRLRLRRDLRAGGGVLAAPVSIAMLDAAGINVDPINVLALTHIDIDVFDGAHDVAELQFRSQVTREARTMVFTEAVVTDAADPTRLVAFGTANWSVITPTPPGDFRYPEPGEGIPDSPEVPPLWEAYTGRRRDDGRLVIPGLSPEVGTMRLHHGPMSVVTEAAALEAARLDVGDDDFRVEHLAMSLLTPGRTGPFVAHPEVVGSSATSVGVRVELRDEGHDDRLVARTWVRLRRADGSVLDTS